MDDSYFAWREKVRSITLTENVSRKTHRLPLTPESTQRLFISIQVAGPWLRVLSKMQSLWTSTGSRMQQYWNGRDGRFDTFMTVPSISKGTLIFLSKSISILRYSPNLRPSCRKVMPRCSKVAKPYATHFHGIPFPQHPVTVIRWSKTVSMTETRFLSSTLNMREIMIPCGISVTSRSRGIFRLNRNAFCYPPTSAIIPILLM